ncbi:phage/plasmid replication protein, II/X family [Chromobacterium amazonense]|uniref:phage/plasmid replication protein, II/X family n=1 Tax=Chromobacterium amazonense TaxID=1382803 RepID=UPI00237EA454|nr:phage/plasmid replication protein, II/X family [Chromobacterium amazonense]MDE1716314.1 phage/plasmid replication protein, II/X family [Chromobacterium amazonense]
MIFVDFIRIKQKWCGLLNPETGEVEPVLPIVDSGVVGKWGRDMETGEINENPEWGAHGHLHIRGSFDSLIRVRCDGFTVELEGNIGRLDRPDNLFNLDFDQTIEACNKLLARFRLPPFCKGERVRNENPSDYDMKKGVSPMMWTGATISELHVTQNYATGSEANANAFVRWLSTQSMSNIKRGRTAPESCTWGSEGGRKKITAYIKHLEMLAPGHCHGRSKPQIKLDPVYRFAQEQGIVRLELKAKRLLLRDAGLRYLGDITMPALVNLFNEHVGPLVNRTREDLTTLDIDALPSKLKLTAACYLRGEDVRRHLSTATFYRHAKELRAYGIDIAEPLAKFDKVNHVIKVIEISPVAAPDWYWQHQHDAFVADERAQLERAHRKLAQAANEEPARIASVANSDISTDRLDHMESALQQYRTPDPIQFKPSNPIDRRGGYLSPDDTWPLSAGV